MNKILLRSIPKFLKCGIVILRIDYRQATLITLGLIVVWINVSKFNNFDNYAIPKSKKNNYVSNGHTDFLLMIIDLLPFLNYTYLAQIEFINKMNSFCYFYVQTYIIWKYFCSWAIIDTYWGFVLTALQKITILNF